MDKVFVALSQFQQELAPVIAAALVAAYSKGFEDGQKEQHKEQKTQSPQVFPPEVRSGSADNPDRCREGDIAKPRR